MENHKIYLSRRNLQTLLNKLDRNKSNDPEKSVCTLIKCDNQHPKYPQTMDTCVITALEDEEYYSDRSAGEVHHKDEPK